MLLKFNRVLIVTHLCSFIELVSSADRWSRAFYVSYCLTLRLGGYSFWARLHILEKCNRLIRCVDWYFIWQERVFGVRTDLKSLEYILAWYIFFFSVLTAGPISSHAVCIVTMFPWGEKLSMSHDSGFCDSFCGGGSLVEGLGQNVDTLRYSCGLWELTIFKNINLI